MTELSQGSPNREITAPQRRSRGGGNRCYVRLAVIGDRTSQRTLSPRLRRWPQLVAEMVAAQHDISYCDISTAGATSYDIRRAQLRVALAHRPHLVALDLGAWSLYRHREDIAEVRQHLTHCAQMLNSRGAVLVTAGSNHWIPRFDREQQLHAVYTELAERFGTIHLDRVGGSSAMLDQFVSAVSNRGLELERLASAQ